MMEILTVLKKIQSPKGPLPGWKEVLITQTKGKVFQAEPMRNHTSMRVGGPAELLIIPEDEEDLIKIMGTIREYLVPWMVVGYGSNLLVKDGGIGGVVLKLSRCLHFLRELKATEDSLEVEVGAGFPLPRLVEFSKERGLTGLEYLYGIPGTVGGSLRMNAGTGKVEMKDIVTEVSLLTTEGVKQCLGREKLHFSYRHLKLPVPAVILSGKFCLRKEEPASVETRLAEYRQYRHQTQPLDLPSLGSVFKNPEGFYAGHLIEEAGLKDVRVGGARISQKHGNFIVNEGGAKAADILALIGLIKDKVKEFSGVSLELEIKVVGEEGLMIQ